MKYPKKIKWQFRNLKIKWKLLLAFNSLLLLSLGMMLTAYFSLNSILKYQIYNKEIYRLDNQFMKLNTLVQEFLYQGFKEVDFLETGHSKQLQEYADQYKHTQQLFNTLTISPLSEKLRIDQDFVSVQSAFEEYHQRFTILKNTLKVRGFKDHGLEGDLRASIHAVENNNIAATKVSMLMLRRHEKDFFLRADLKYLEKFNQEIENFIGIVNQLPADQDTDLKSNMMNNIRNYQAVFSNIVTIEQKIGLTPETGYRGKLLLQLNEVEQKLLQLGTTSQSKIERIIRHSFLILGIIVLAQLIAGLIMAYMYANFFRKNIQELSASMHDLSNGKFPEQFTKYSYDELGQTKRSLNNLVQRIKTAANFALKLGEGDLKIHYPPEYQNDVLANAMILMQEKLTALDEQEAVIKWKNQGSSYLNEIIHQDSISIENLADKIIQYITQYLQANQGAIYLLEKEEDRMLLKRVATYAYQRKKYLEQQIEVGQGLTGQAVLEKDTIYLTDVPQDYLTISSGLGQSQPSSILIVPLKVKEEVNGVIELASFRQLKPYEIEFVEKISESIASILYSRKITLNMQKLLHESQEKAEQLASQEEEIRQNSEELQAFQEQMKRDKEILENELADYYNRYGKLNSDACIN